MADSNQEMIINRILSSEVLLALEAGDRQVTNARNSQHYKHEQAVILSIAQYEALRKQIYASHNSW